MRLRTCNSRRKRLLGRLKDPKCTPFCYIVYGKRVLSPIKDSNDWTINYEVKWREWKRPFDSYAMAIAHLTRVKLAIEEEDFRYHKFTPCKIVEGVYTKPGKEKITKVTRLNNECDRPPERHFGSGLPRQQRTINFPVSQDMGSSTYRWAAHSTSGGSGAITSCSGLPAVDSRGNEYKWFP